MKHLLALPIVAVLLISGCVSVSPETIIASSPIVQGFFAEYPNAELRAVFYSADEIDSIMDEIKSDCQKETITAKDYYKVTISDADSGLSVTAWVDWNKQVVECAVKKGTPFSNPDEVDGIDCDRDNMQVCMERLKNALKDCTPLEMTTDSNVGQGQTHLYRVSIEGKENDLCVLNLEVIESDVPGYEVGDYMICKWPMHMLEERIPTATPEWCEGPLIDKQYVEPEPPPQRPDDFWYTGFVSSMEPVSAKMYRTDNGFIQIHLKLKPFVPSSIKISDAYAVIEGENYKISFTDLPEKVLPAEIFDIRGVSSDPVFVNYPVRATVRITYNNLQTGLTGFVESGEIEFYAIYDGSENPFWDNDCIDSDGGAIESEKGYRLQYIDSSYYDYGKLSWDYCILNPEDGISDEAKKVTSCKGSYECYVVEHRCEVDISYSHSLIRCENGCYDGACNKNSAENCTKIPFVDADGDGCHAGTDSDCGGIEGVDDPMVSCFNHVDDDCDGMVDTEDSDLSCNLDCGDGVCGWYENIKSSEYYCAEDCAGTCTDSDGGFNIGKKGNVPNVVPDTCAYISERNTVEGIDFCEGSHPNCFLIEGSCDKPSEDLVVVSVPIWDNTSYVSYVNCPYGCEDGACIRYYEEIMLGITPAEYAGTDISSDTAGNEICKNHFGEDWRWVEFHDDPVEKQWRIRGKLAAGFDDIDDGEFLPVWVWINDQNAECYNTGYDKGLTFRVMPISGEEGYVHAACIGYSNTEGTVPCNAYIGDTSCTLRRRLLCLKDTEQTITCPERSYTGTTTLNAGECAEFDVDGTPYKVEVIAVDSEDIEAVMKINGEANTYAVGDDIEEGEFEAHVDEVFGSPEAAYVVISFEEVYEWNLTDFSNEDYVSERLIYEVGDELQYEYYSPCLYGILVESSGNCSSYNDCETFLYVYELVNASCVADMFSTVPSSPGCTLIKVNGEDVYECSFAYYNNNSFYAWTYQNYIFTVGGTDEDGNENYMQWIMNQYS